MNFTAESTPRQEQAEPSETVTQPSLSSQTVYHTKSGYYAASTEALLDRMVEAATHKDPVLLEKMEQAGLIYPVYPNQEVIVTGCHGFICSIKTFRYKGKLKEHWTVAEAIESRQVPVTQNNTSVQKEKATFTNIPERLQDPRRFFKKRFTDVASQLNINPNQVNHIIQGTRLLLEANDGNEIDFAEVDISNTKCNPQKPLDTVTSEAALKAAGIDMSSLRYDHQGNSNQVYQDDINRLQIMVICSYDGAPISIGFSRTYYGK